MKEQTTSNLYNQNEAFHFYEDRYEQGYIEEWPVEIKKKIIETIQSLGLPSKGEALDFGCGNGILTETVRQALPDWKIYGSEIIKKAVDNARKRYPKCTFFESDNPEFKNKKFDFIFSNHVFEHVYNLGSVFSEMVNLLKQESYMLHIMPCGNKGSYEHKICMLRQDGIDPTTGNRFFYEDEGHVRRLTTDDFCELCKTQNFELTKEFYSNQYFGAIDWITKSNIKFVSMLTDHSKAIDKEAERKLRRIRRKLIIITVLRRPVQIFKFLINMRNKRLKHNILMLTLFPFYLLLKPIDKLWEKRTKKEWDNNKFNRNGSEMWLYFTRV